MPGSGCRITSSPTDPRTGRPSGYSQAVGRTRRTRASNRAKATATASSKTLNFVGGYNAFGINAILLRASPPLTKRVLEAGPQLKIIAKHGAGI